MSLILMLLVLSNYKDIKNRMYFLEISEYVKRAGIRPGQIKQIFIKLYYVTIFLKDAVAKTGFKLY